MVGGQRSRQAEDPPPGEHASWRRANSEEQEEEDDDDAQVSPGDTSSQPSQAGPSEGLGFSRSPSSSLTNCLLSPVHLGIWVPKKGLN